MNNLSVLKVSLSILFRYKVLLQILEIAHLIPWVEKPLLCIFVDFYIDYVAFSLAVISLEFEALICFNLPN